MAHYRFNRHQLFTPEDTSEVLAIIGEVSDLSIDVTDPDTESRLDILTNMLSGLFDGYLYDNILTTAASIAKLPMDTIRRIVPIVDKIVADILANGQSETQVH